MAVINLYQFQPTQPGQIFFLFDLWQFISIHWYTVMLLLSVFVKKYLISPEVYSLTTNKCGQMIRSDKKWETFPQTVWGKTSSAQCGNDFPCKQWSGGVASTEQTGCECGRPQLAAAQMPDLQSVAFPGGRLYLRTLFRCTELVHWPRLSAYLGGSDCSCYYGVPAGCVVSCERAVCSCRSGTTTDLLGLGVLRVHSRLLLLLGEPVWISSASRGSRVAQYPCWHRNKMSAEVRTRVPTSVLEYDLIQKRRKLGDEKVVGWGLIVTVLVFTLAATAAELVLAQITHCISLLVLSYQVGWIYLSEGFEPIGSIAEHV